MSNEINKRVDRIRTFFKKVQPQNHPIKDHPVAGCDEYVKGIYFDMLCVIAMYENDDTENQNRFIQRLMVGSGDTLTITDHIKRAMEITTDKVNELIVQVKSSSLTEILFIDSLIISCANGLPNRKQTELLAELGDTLGLNKDSIKFCSELAVGILEQDFDKIKECVGRYNNVETIVENADCYIMPIIDKNITSDTCDMHYYSLLKNYTPLFAEKKQLKNYDSVVIENMRLDQKLEFVSITEVKLIGCLVENISGIAVAFKGVQNVMIDSCIFRDLKAVFSFGSSDIKVTISNSDFEDCYNSYNHLGTIINSTEKTTITFNNCILKSIGSNNNEGIISYNNYIIANNCEFYNCNQGGCLVYRSHQKDGYFQNNNNTFIGCASISGFRYKSI